MSQWKRLRKKYGSLHGELGYQPYQKPVTVNIDALTFEELERLKKDKEASEKQQELDELFFFVNCIEGEVGGGRHSFATPVPNLSDYENKAKNSDVHVLRDVMEDAQLKIQGIHKTIKTLKDAVLAPEIKEKAEKYASNIVIRYESGNTTNSTNIRWGQYADLAALTKEKVECLKEAVKFYRKVTHVYENELQRRGGQKGIISDIMKQAGQICKEAEKCQKAVVKANQKTAESDKAPTFETAKAFMENREQFLALQGQYSSLTTRIKHITDETVNLPPFPRGLSVDETSRKTVIKHVYRREKMRIEREQQMRR